MIIKLKRVAAGFTLVDEETERPIEHVEKTVAGRQLKLPIAYRTREKAFAARRRIYAKLDRLKKRAGA